MQGPLFTNVLLADEINRTPPKTQAALLEAMQERHVTVGSNTYRLPEPFFVLATQNPIEQEGTYPLPEAQLDRFMFNIIVKYPSAAEELLILKQTTGGEEPELWHALTGKQILALQEVVRKVPVPAHVFVYARDLVRATRPEEPEAPDFIRNYISWGAGPRAGQYLILGAKARAILEGPVSRHQRRRPGGRPSRAAAPAADELPGQQRRCLARQGHRSADRNGPGRTARTSEEAREVGVHPMSAVTQYPHLCLDAGGTVRIGSTRYKVRHLAAEHYHYGWSAEEIMRQHPDLRPEEVYAALTYFYDHYDEMVSEMKASAEVSEDLVHPQPLSRNELLARKWNSGS